MIRINLFKKVNGAKNEFDDTEFRRAIGSNTGIIAEPSGERKNIIILVPMKSLSLDDFRFPFSNSTKIREALKLQVMPFSAAGELEIFPVTITKTLRGEHKGSEGIVWYVSPEELGLLDIDVNVPKKIWPAPLAFISRLEKYNGNGVTLWIDENNISSILWQNNRPVLTRWRKFTGKGSEEKELKWYDEYCKARELERGGNFTVNAAGNIRNPESDEMFYDIVNESIEICPWLSEVNLSRSAIEGERDLERIVKLLTRASVWLLIIGGIYLGTNLLKLYKLQNQINDLRSSSEGIYREVFDPSHTGRISNPVTLARDKIAELSGTGTDSHTLEEILSDMGEIFASDQDMNITIDTVRYNAEGIDCTGVSPDMSTILKFRKLWETKVNLVQLDNTQFVSGIGYRFDLRLRW